MNARVQAGRWVPVGLLLLLAACSLGLPATDECESSEACAGAFGLGSTCDKGYCTAPTPCNTAADCISTHGTGACVEGSCSGAFPEHPQCTWSGREPNLTILRGPILLGSVWDLAEPTDQALSLAVRMAVDEVNALGGLGDGRPVSLITCDASGGNAAARDASHQEALRYLSSVLGTVAAVGPFSSADTIRLASAVKRERAPIVFMTPSATSPAISTLDDHLNPGDPGLFWRTCPSDLLQADALASLVDAAVPADQTVAVVYTDEAYGQGLGSAFRDSFGPERTVPFAVGSDTDPASIASSVASATDGGIVLIASRASETLRILAGLETALGTRPLFLTDGSKDAAVLLSATGALRTWIAQARGTAPSARTEPGSPYEAFAQRFAERSGTPADAFSFTAHAYDAAYLLLFALLDVSSKSLTFEASDVARSLAKLSDGEVVRVGAVDDFSKAREVLKGNGSIDVDGASGPLKLDAETGDSDGTIGFWKIRADFSGFEAATPPDAN